MTDETTTTETEAPLLQTEQVETKAEETKTEETTAGETKAEETTAEETKTEETKAEETKDEDKVPEAYADFTIPDDMEIDKDMLDAFLPQFKEQGLTQKQAQERVNDAAKLATHWQQKAIDGFEQTTKGWREAIKTDPAFGGEKLGETLALGKRVIDTFGAEDAELKEVIDAYRLGDNPGFIRLMARVGGAISEDVFVAGGKARAAPSLTDTLYPTMKKKD